MHQLECICAAVSEGLPDHCILVTSGGPSSLPIIISSAYSDYSFSVEKYFLSMSSLIFLIIHLDSRLSLWQRKATQVLSSAAVLIPQTLASVSQLFLTVIQWWNKRMLQSLISADNVGSPPSRAVNWSLFFLFQLENLGAPSGAENIAWEAVSTMWGQHQKK